jgi:hypothetical protein
VPTYCSQSWEHISCFPKRPTSDSGLFITRLSVHTPARWTGAHRFSIRFLYCVIHRFFKTDSSAFGCFLIHRSILTSSLSFNVLEFLYLLHGARESAVPRKWVKFGRFLSTNVRQLFSDSMLWDYKIQNMQFLLFRSTRFFLQKGFYFSNFHTVRKIISRRD